MDTCGDNRFEIIEKAKKDILESTNISDSESEMQVLDTFLFRCWQMGWLKCYDEPKQGAKVDSVPEFDPERAFQVSLLEVQSTLLHQIVNAHQKVDTSLRYERNYDGSFDKGYIKGLLEAYSILGAI